MAKDFGEFLNRDDSSSDPERDFESYLKEKQNRWTPPSQQDEIPTASEQRDILIQYPGIVQDVAENSSNGRRLPTAVPADISDGSNALVVVEERKTTAEVRGVPGYRYVVESSIPMTVDKKWLDARDESRRIAVTEMTAEQCIRRRADLEELVFLSRAQQQGLTDAIAELLRSENEDKRAALAELSSQLMAKAKGRAKASSEPKAKKAKAVDTHKAAQKMVDVFHKQGLPREFCVSQLQTQNLYDAVIEAYVAAKYGQ